jgi:hypothetical protein
MAFTTTAPAMQIDNNGTVIPEIITIIRLTRADLHDDDDDGGGGDKALQ